jgi:transposase-like protein
MKSKPSVKNPEVTDVKGFYHCGDCRKRFTVRTGTVYERSHIALHKWLFATWLLCSSKKGMSAHQLHRMIGVTYKSAWFMAHRIREAMNESNPDTMGGNGIVEADETYFGKKSGAAPELTTAGKPFTKRKGAARIPKRSVVSLVERGGKVRSFHVDRADKETVVQILMNNVAQSATLFTDESRLYTGADTHFAGHETVNHASGEYVRGIVNTNSIEGFFSIFKRGMKGVYQHCSEKHLQRYLSEFDFRYNSRDLSDAVRTTLAIKGAEGKRLMYV